MSILYIQKQYCTFTNAGIDSTLNLLVWGQFKRNSSYGLSFGYCGLSEPLGIAYHRGFLELWNSQKSVSNIWPHFSCLLDEGIPKICKKLNSHDGFLSYLQNSTANSAHLAANFCPALVCPQKADVRIQFFPYLFYSIK